MSKHIMHLLPSPPGDGGYRTQMVSDVFEAFELFVQTLEANDSPNAEPLRAQLDFIERKRTLPLAGVMMAPGGPWRSDWRQVGE